MEATSATNGRVTPWTKGKLLGLAKEIAAGLRPPPEGR
jgi:hypothetical protein